MPRSNPKTYGTVISEEILDAATTVIESDNRLRYRKIQHPIGGELRFWFRGPWEQPGRQDIAMENPHEILMYFIWFMYLRRILREAKPQAKIAHIGAGTCILPRLFSLRQWGRVDIYEIQQEIVDRMITEHAEPEWNFIAGDYRDTLSQRPYTYDLIFYSIGDDNGDIFDQDIVENQLTRDGRWYRLDKLLSDEDREGQKRKKEPRRTKQWPK